MMLPNGSEAVIPLCDLPMPIILVDDIWNIAALVDDQPELVERNVIFKTQSENRSSVVCIKLNLWQQSIVYKIIMYCLIKDPLIAFRRPSLTRRAHEMVDNCFQIICHQISWTDGDAGTDN